MWSDWIAFEHLGFFHSYMRYFAKNTRDAMSQSGHSYATKILLFMNYISDLH